MQYLNIPRSTTLLELSEMVGSKNIDSVLNVNGLTRVPKIGEQFYQKSENVMQTAPDVDVQRRISILNQYSNDSDIFETLAMMDDNGWKLMSATNNIPEYLQIPDSTHVPDSISILGSKVNIATPIYEKTITSLQATGSVDPSIFNNYNSIKPAQMVDASASAAGDGLESIFPIPWGKISIYSTLSDSMMDIPVYPEDPSDSRKANYTEMPELLYQYEPWQIYKSSGPRQNTYSFFMHRDLWQSDHRKGGANELIRFCEANCYPEYKGSAVYTSTVTLYINGKALITGVLTDVAVDWSGPIGQDGYYLAFKLSLTITEVASEPLNFKSVREKKLIG